MKPQVALVCGGKSAEHEISCLSALGIFEAIDRERFDVSLFGITQSGVGFIRLAGRADFDADPNAMPIVPDRGDESEDGPQVLPSGIDLIFPVLHGSNGEDGVFQGFAEFLQINYLGSGVLASALAMDKVRAKEIFKSAGLTVAPGVSLRSRDDLKSLPLQLPLFVKPSCGGSSRGTVKVKSGADLGAAIDEALRFDDVALIEEAIVGRELECALLEVDGEILASVVGEIRVLGNREFYDYEAKYLDSATEYLVPAPIAAEVSARIQESAKIAFRAVGCSGLARVDFFLAEDGAIVINELNTMPGFTPKSVFPMLWKASGREYREVITVMIEEALRNPKI
jgi:D-alanine-D-alanine ligase